MFINNDFIEKSVWYSIHASSFAPVMDAIHPRRFFIEYVDAE